MWNNHRQDGHPDHTNKQQPGVNRRGFLKQSSLAAGTATALSFLGITPFPAAHAASESDVTSTLLTASQAEPYIQTVLNSSDYHRFQHLVQHIQDGIFTIQEQQATVMQMTMKAETGVVVRIPVIGGAGYSYYLAWFQPRAMTILQTQGALFKSAGSQNIDVYAERNGLVVLQKVLAPDGKPVDGSSVITPNVDLGCLAGCLAVPAYVLAIVIGICCTSFLILCAVCIAESIHESVGVVQGCIFKCS